MNYEEEARRMLVELFRERWMDDDDWNDFIDALPPDQSIKQMAKDIQTGIKNGWSLETQKSFIRAAFGKRNN